MIFCYRGWVKVVYEDQGEPFILQAGDCVLQPPEIRHRVLESSPGLEVIEIGCPAEHATLAEQVITLPTPQFLPDRDFAGQLFVRHQAESATWLPWRYDGFEYRDLWYRRGDIWASRCARSSANHCGPNSDVGGRKRILLHFHHGGCYYLGNPRAG